MKVDVIGGSLAGLSAAITLARAGADVDVYERASFESIDLGAGLGVAMDLLRRVVGDEAAELATTGATKRCVWRGDRESVEPTALSFTTYAALRRALRDRIPNARYHANVGLKSLVHAAHGAEFETTTGARTASDLLVCADGRHSRSRAFFAEGGPAGASYAGYVLLRALVPDERFRPALRERLFSDALHIAVSDGHQMVAYPVPGRLLNWGWYYGVDEAALARFCADRRGVFVEGTLAPGSMSPETMRLVAESIGVWSGPSRALADDVLASDCVAIHPIYEYASPRLANGAACLVGDAAHLASPITGAGGRLAMIDAIVLADALEQVGPDGEAVAARFEQHRLAESRAVVGAGRQRGSVFRVNERSRWR